ncbi:hypothetical protein [Microbacterium album]|uniref:Uncharacterized protein n=1 Tax=Microbacterium album TaxID=2053191 RepID=A0A917IB69_9MICO|nr:hypothetical protein [Microbacterium album]GGH34069.1 hypothetical protein GCM10010921_01490 [Microbacterium album]
MTIPTTLALDPAWTAWTKRYEWHLDHVPGLLELMRDSTPRISSDSARYGKERTSSSREAPVPFSIDAVDDADDLWGALAAYTLEVAELLGEHPPHVLRASWWRAGQVQGIRAAADARKARSDAFEVVAWLVDRETLIAAETGLQDSEEHLFALVRKSRARWQAAPRARSARPRPCHVCGEVAVLIDWMDVPGGIGPALPVGRCSRCGQQYERKPT